ncbi:MAG: 30S ribosomal protein S2 [Planctomycetota bacterium]|nr:30S ribosomal protein S2 [Planctomycetota bacterium]
MEQISVQNLIDAGVHFGCRASRWNPKMAPFIHGRRNRIHIIDLRQTMRGLLRAQNLLFRLASEGQNILWVGTKRQVKGVILDAGARTGMPVVTERWIGGTLTNFSVIRSRLRRLEELESIDEAKAEELKLTKKELSSISRERRKITRNLGGIREMNAVPAAMVVVDPSREGNAIREAKKMGLIVIGMLDTDCDPSDVDIVIPGNDDALKSVRLVIEQLSASVEEGAHQHTDQLRAAGGAEKQEDAAPNPGGEPRPTTSRELPKRREENAGDAPAAEAPAAAPAAAPATEAPAEAPAAAAPVADADAPKTDA